MKSCCRSFEGVVFYLVVVFKIFYLSLVLDNFAMISLGIIFSEFVQLWVHRTSQISCLIFFSTSTSSDIAFVSQSCFFLSGIQTITSLSRVSPHTLLYFLSFSPLCISPGYFLAYLPGY